MSFVPAICTQCNAKIEVDDTKDAGICQYCGTAFVTEKVIVNYNTYVTTNNNFAGANINILSGNLDNYIKIAKNAIDAGNGKEAIDYTNKALEINPESSQAWILKMKAVGLVGTIGNPQVTEAINYGDNAIKFSSDKEKTKAEVFDYYIKRAIELMLVATSQLKDVAQIKQMSGLGVTAMQSVAKADAATRTMYLNLASPALLLKLKIDNGYLAENIAMQEQVVALANLYASMCEADVERLSIYGSKLLPEALTARQNTLAAFKQGLPDEKANKVNDAGVQKNNGNCYVATAVYGSYDCPEVWTLRRFRDYTLAETWYGRAFVRTYYAISPSLVKWFGHTAWFKKLWKGTLDCVVASLKERGIADTPYRDKIW